MSRTDAHRPGWVQRFDRDNPVQTCHDHRHDGCWIETLLDARHVGDRLPPRRSTDYPTCRPRFTVGYTTGASRFYGDHADRAFARVAYHGPQRRQERDSLRMAARDWNTHGDTDIEPEHRQARHSLEWLWW